MNENHLEEACLDWLAGLGWTCVHGDDVSPGAEPELRSRYSDVVLIAPGDSALAGVSFKIPQFGESDFPAIEEALATDPEQRDFIELAAACEGVVRSLARIAA